MLHDMKVCHHTVDLHGSMQVKGMTQQTPDVPGHQGMSYFGQAKIDVVTIAW